MEAQTLVLSVSHLNLHSCDNSKSFMIRINEQLCNRIKELSALVESQGVDWIEEESNRGIWADTSYGEFIKNGGTHDGAMLNIMAYANKVSKTMIRINKTHFHFCGIPNGCDEQSKMLTAEFPINKIDINTRFIAEGF